MKQFIKLFHISALTILFVGCKDPSRTKTMDFGLFTLEVPYKWQQVKQNGIDSYIGAIAVGNTDTLYFDLGLYSNSLTEPNIQVITREMIEENNLDSSDFVVVNDIMSMNIDADLYRKQNVSWDTIDNRRAKIVFPRISGRGMTGVYIGSLWGDSSKVRFNLHGSNLNAQTEQDLLKAIKTLRFHKRNMDNEEN
ncbi:MULTISPECIES: hypothetical protein [Sphingobacterium]|uniref:Uncharacterized protein n=1 Tax=Sphingobacterium paramultivorum TaxID=2886510 RepID=A0A7G5DZC2_9SPHI|nr:MULTISPECIES: hypothetical protein [Sphingobacterium]QMV67097.1 hypothetical protein HS960_05245 [Sphingobacterium paramultivorum]WSO15941.1 hypothetical protein VUL84_05220 [Sphingobacterium paramultivorum]